MQFGTLKRRGRVVPVLLTVLLMIGTVGGLAAYLVHRGSAGIPGGPRLGHADELTLMPGTAVAFVHVRYAAARGTESFDELRKFVARTGPQARAALDGAAFDPDTIDRLTVVFLRAPGPAAPALDAKGPPVGKKGPPGKKGGGGPPAPPPPPPPGDLIGVSPVRSVVVFTFAAPYDADRVRATFLKKPTEKRFENRTYAEDADANAAVYSPDKTTLVLGEPAGVELFVAARRTHETLGPALERAAEGGRHVVAAFNLGLFTFDPRWPEKLTPAFRPLKDDVLKLSRTQTVSFEVAFGERPRVEIRGKFRTEALAEEALTSLRAVADRAHKPPEPPAADDEKTKVKEPELVAKLTAAFALPKLDAWLADAAIVRRDDEVVIAPKQTPADVYAALNAAAALMFKPPPEPPNIAPPPRPK